MAGEVAAVFSSIDGTTKVSGFLTEPDRYRHLFDDRRTNPIIARGGGLSYVAASMGEGVLSVGMRHFDRVLDFDAATGIVEVEAGVRLDTVLIFLLNRGFVLPVIPGHPAITVGGCIACDVHGKNPARDQTFRAHVVSLDLWHPRLGLRRIEGGTPAFEATCGGFGLTGIVVSVRLQARSVDGTMAQIFLTPVSNLDEAQEILRQKAASADLLYSWHDWKRPDSARGYIVEGVIVRGRAAPQSIGVPRNIPVGRRYALMNRFTIPVFNAVYGVKLSRSNGKTAPLTEALFPLSSLGFYYRLFGHGLVEHQVLVPNRAWPQYWPALGRLFHEHGVRPVVTSLRMFGGLRKGIGFSGDGVSLTFDLVNNARAHALLSKLDIIDSDVGAVTNPAKDSRLSAEVFRRQAPGYEAFLAQRTVLDPDGSFRSALSTRLAL